MVTHIAWLAPLAWGLTAFCAVMFLKAPRASRPSSPEPTHAAASARIRDAA